MGLTELLKLLSWIFKASCKDCMRGSVPVMSKATLLRNKDDSHIEREIGMTYYCPRHAMERVSPTKTVRLADKLELKNPLSKVGLPKEIG